MKCLAFDIGMQNRHARKELKEDPNPTNVNLLE